MLFNMIFLDTEAHMLYDSESTHNQTRALSRRAAALPAPPLRHCSAFPIHRPIPTPTSAYRAECLSHFGQAAGKGIERSRKARPSIWEIVAAMVTRARQCALRFETRQPLCLCDPACTSWCQCEPVVEWKLLSCHRPCWCGYGCCQ